jgi:RHS repeat-associated protein
VRPDRSLLRLLSITCLLFLSCSVGQAQVTQVGDDTSTPIPGVGHDYIHLLDETVNPANGSLSLRIVVPMPPGRGVTIPFAFAYDSNGVNHLVSDVSGNAFWAGNTDYLAQGGWSYSVPMFGNRIVNQSSSSGTCSYATDYMFQDPSGDRHSLYLSVGSSNYMAGLLVQCGLNVSTGGDVQYYASTPPGCNNGCGLQEGLITVSDSDGTVYSGGPGSHTCPTCGLAYSGIVSSVEDRNGNKITLTDHGNGAITITDTLGRPAISTSGLGTSGTTNSVSVAGLTNAYQIQWETASANYVVPKKGMNSLQSCSIAGVNNSQIVAQSLVLPNQQKYQFFYDSTYGLLKEIIYPGGAWVKYTWKFSDTYSELADFPVNNSFYNGPCDFEYSTPVIATRTVSFDGATPALTQTFSYSTTWPSNGGNWTAKATTVATTDNILNKTFTTVYSYSPYLLRNDPDDHGTNVADYIPIESQIQYYDWAGSTPIRTVTKSWLDVYRLKSQQTTLDNNQSSQIVYPTYSAGVGPQSAGSLATEVDEYDFGQTTPTRKTVTTFQSFSNTPGVITDRPCQIVISDGSGNPAAETDYSYDGATSLCSPISAAVATGGSGGYSGHDGVTFSTTATTPRGNATKKTQRCFVGTTTCSNPVTVFTYDETGQVLSAKDANGNTTQYSYTDSFSDSTPSMPTDAYLTKITYPPTGSVSHVESFSYAYSDGQLTVSTDQNLLQTHYFYVDPLRRLTETDYPNTGKTTLSYNDSPPSPTVTTSKLMNQTPQSIITAAVMDGLGHVVQSQLQSDPQGTVYTATAYYGTGLAKTVTNPYRSGADPTSSQGTTTIAYDALGRKITETAPDGSVTQTQNCGPNTKVTDPVGKWRRSRLDGLGRLVEVDEPNSTTATVTACPGSGEPIWVTAYSYDTLGNLTKVLQNGSHQRTFTYNSLSQLLCSSNPESSTVACPVPDPGTYTTGTARYSYDPVGNVSSKEDARAITTTYQYDALRREISRTYSNGDPSVTTHYDEPTCLFTPCANVGHRTSMTDAAGSEIWSYVDFTGRSQKRTTTSSPANITATTHYFFDFAGNLETIWYPFPIFTAMDYTNDSAGRPSTAYDSEQFTHFFGPSKTPPSGCPSTGVCYTPQGSIYSASIGADDGSGGLVLSNTYNNRLQPLELKASYAGVSAMDLTYGFVDPTTLKNNGNVTAITNNLNSGRSQKFAYDQLNRIISAGTTATTGGFCWGYQYSHDSWGNLLSQAGWTPTYSACVGTIMSPVTADGRNHISGLSYDSSGNTLSDGVNAYSWNGENELKSAAGVTYLYDGDGHRVSKSSGKLYWYGLDGKLLTETDAAGNRLNTYAYLGDQRISEFPAPLGSPALYYAADFLDTSRAIVKQGSTLCYDADFTPFGGERAYTNTCTQNFKFTGKERDTESGLDDFDARYYNSRVGKFMSPDWSAVPMGVPYADPGNPQSLNLYTYVVNNPLRYVDPTGHDCVICPPEPTPADWALIEAAGGSTLTAAPILLLGTLPVAGAVFAATHPVAAPEDGCSGPFCDMYVYSPPQENQPGSTQPPSPTPPPPPSDPQMAEHTKGKRKSTKGKHQKGTSRKQIDRGGEKGDDRPGRLPRKRPDGWKGPWPPKTPEPPPKPRDDQTERPLE